MAGLKEIRSRINTVKTTMQVTSAMKMVSAAKLKKAQNELLRSRPYSEKLYELLAHLLNSEEVRDKVPYLKTQDSEKLLFIVVTSNRGLCGAFNSGLVKAFQEAIKNEYAGKEYDAIAIGKQGQKLMLTRKLNCISNYNDLYDNLTFNSVEELSTKFTNDFLNGTYKKIVLVYTNFVSAGTLRITFETFLPIEVPEEDETGNKHNYIYEPGKEALLLDLIPKALQMHFYMTILNSFTAEHAARMQSMNQATDNANSLLRDLTLMYNKARQATITNEILEITGGAEALKSK